MGSSGSKLLHCRCSQQPLQTSNLLSEETELLRAACEPAKEESSDCDADGPNAAEFSLRRLPYQCQRLIADRLSTDDLLSLCQTSPDNCRVFGSGVFWLGRQGANAQAESAAFECLNAALERKLCLPVESLNGTYLPSLEDVESYSGRVVYLHDLNCGGGVGGVGDVSDVSGGGRLCIHDVVPCVPRGSYLVSLRAKLGPHWRLKGVTEVLLVPEPPCPGAGPVRARIPERRWCDLAFRHGYERWFTVSLGRLCLTQSCSIQVQIVNAKVSKSQLKEGVYLDHIELAPLHCPLAEFTGYRRAAVRQRRRGPMALTSCQLL